jgi:RNA polymerase sigma factor FliA
VSQAVQQYRDVGAQRKRDELILAHLPLVRHTVGRLIAHLPNGLDLDNLEAAGVLGLVEAANHFDPERGVRFEVFAAWRIRGAVFDELRRNCPLPQHLLERIAKVRQAYQTLTPPVTVEALAAETGLEQEEVNDCLAALRMARTVSWEGLSEPRQAQAAVDEPRGEAELEDQKLLLARCIEELTERERLVVTLYYLEELRLKEIGEVLKLSESRVSRLLNAGLFHLGEFMRLQEGD